MELRGQRKRRIKAWTMLGMLAAMLILLHKLIVSLVFQVLLGAAVAWVLSPLCKALERKLPRSWAALTSILALLAALLATLLLPPLVRQVGMLAEQMQPLIAQIRGMLDGLGGRISAMGLPSLMDEDMWQRLGNYFGMALAGIAQQASGIASVGMALAGIAQQASGIASGLSLISLALMLAYYFLRDREMFLRRTAMLVPLAYRRRALRAAAEMRREIGGYVRGQGIVSLAVGSLTALGLFIIGMPAWLALGMWMMLFDLIPYFGPFLGAIPVLMFSVSGGLSRILWAMGVVIIVQQFENNIISPRVLGGSTGLHPVAVVIALSIGGALMGVWGLLLALPVAVAARGALRVLRYYEE